MGTGVAAVSWKIAPLPPTRQTKADPSSNWSVGGKVTFGAITVGGTIAENNALGKYENAV